MQIDKELTEDELNNLINRKWIENLYVNIKKVETVCTEDINDFNNHA